MCWRFPGVGNIGIDSGFVKPGYWADPNNPNLILEPNDANAVWVNGDYHLQSEGWRWGINRHRWTYDDVTSRCIDAGNPAHRLVMSRFPSRMTQTTNGPKPSHRYGCLWRHSRSFYPPYDWAILGDLTNDGIIDFSDFAYQVKDWQTRAEEQSGDLDRNGAVGMEICGYLSRIGCWKQVGTIIDYRFSSCADLRFSIADLNEALPPLLLLFSRRSCSRRVAF